MKTNKKDKAKAEQIKALIKENRPVCYITTQLGVSRALVYYYKAQVNRKPINTDDKLRASYSYLQSNTSQFKAMDFAAFCATLSNNGKYLCYFSGKEIDLQKDKWAVSSNGYFLYMYLKEFAALNRLKGSFKEFAIKILTNAGYKLIEPEDSLF
jgi:hypothetical protein